MCTKCKSGFFLYKNSTIDLAVCIIGNQSTVVPGCQTLISDFDYGVNKCCKKCMTGYYLTPLCENKNCNECSLNYDTTEW